MTSRQIVTAAQIHERDKTARCPSTGCACSYVHDQEGLNYIWLKGRYGFHGGRHGAVTLVEFEEPASDRRDWVGEKYTHYWWTRHCDAVDHNSQHLLQDHLRMFADPQHRINIRFWFEDGFVVQSPSPTASHTMDDRRHYQYLYEIYWLEAQWFAQHLPQPYVQ